MPTIALSTYHHLSGRQNLRNLDKENLSIVRPQQTVPIGALLPFLLGGMCAVIAGPAANFLVEVADKKLGKVETGKPENGDGLAAAVAPALRTAGNLLEKNWELLIRKYPWDYAEIQF
jgi:hypothetical protein